MSALTSRSIERNSGRHMPAGGFGMIADGRCPWRTTALKPYRAAKTPQGASSPFPPTFLLRHTPDASWESYIQLETERVDDA